jgi:hypothetical protein
MKKISRPVAHTEYRRQRKLRLTKEAIRILKADGLAAVNGGCTTTSYTTERRTVTC